MMQTAVGNEKNLAARDLLVSYRANVYASLSYEVTTYFEYKLALRKS